MKLTKTLQRVVQLKFTQMITSGSKDSAGFIGCHSSIRELDDCRTEKLLASRFETQNVSSRSMSSLKKFLDYSKVPKINEADIEIQYVRGSGPGGQATNKTNNAVQIKHKETGIVVKCHQTRSQWDNQKKAIQILTTKLDNLINGENSIEAQIKSIQSKKLASKEKKRRRLDELKAAFKEREGLK
ncbi:mitochondrial translation release factor in rescue [Athalia rosae]|uniref:mitochondrial translation release factor in rescue n=1 Tax=Athalia rosae TaxID=37344 RepID=UPI0020342046|nr:mitochondrial translation release factor in rescue [Athalia rosae]